MSKVILKQTMLYSIGEIIPKIMGFILLPVYTYYLKPSDYGVLTYTSSIIMFLFVLSTLSLNSFVLRNYFELESALEKQRLIGNIFLFITFTNLFIFGLGYFLIPRLIIAYNIQVPWDPYFKLALSINFLESFSIIPLVLYRVRQQANLFVALNLSKVVLQFALTYFFIVHQQIGLIGNYYGQLLPLLPYSLVYCLIIFKNAKFQLNLSQLAQGLKYSLPLLPGALAYLTLSVLDRVILERFVSVTEIGIYNVAVVLSLSLNIIIQSGYKAIEPEIFQRFTKPNFSAFIFQLQSIFLFSVYAAAMFITLFSQEVFKIMTSTSFYKGFNLVPILMIGVIMTGQNVIFGGILTAEKKTKIIGFATMVGAVISVSFNFLLIPVWGIYAAASASAISFTIINLILFYKMDLEGKSIHKEFAAIFLFITVVFFIFFYCRLQVNLKGFLLKVCTLLLYIFVLSRIYNVRIKSLRKFVKG